MKQQIYMYQQRVLPEKINQIIMYWSLNYFVSFLNILNRFYKKNSNLFTIMHITSHHIVNRFLRIPKTDFNFRLFFIGSKRFGRFLSHVFYHLLCLCTTWISPVRSSGKESSINDVTPSRIIFEQPSITDTFSSVNSWVLSSLNHLPLPFNM